MTAYGNGDCVKFISMKAWLHLALYQRFCLGWAGVALGVRWFCMNIMGKNWVQCC